jgi:MATE family multidrug resistance protein
MVHNRGMTAHRHSITEELRALWKLAWPMLVGQVATMGMGVADVAMTGHVNATELAAVALGASVWTIILVTVIGTMMAINTLVAHEVGAGKFDRVPHLVRQSLWKALGVGVVAAVLTNVATLVFDYLMLEPSVNAKASTFVHVISAGMVPFALYRSLYGYTTSINHTKPVMVISLGGLAWNVLVNWLLVFGNLGFPQMGAVGCAIATASGMWLMLFATVAWIRIAPYYRATYPFTHWEAPHWPEIRSMLRLGLPIGVTYFAEVSAFMVVSLLVARFGVVQVSAHQIALNFASLVFMVPMTFGISMITRVGQALGEGDPRRARFVAWTGVALASGVGLANALLMAVFRWEIARAYTSDPAVQQLAVDLLLLGAIFQLSDAVQVATASAIRGYKVTREPMLIQMFAFWVVALPFGCYLGLQLQMKSHGFWIALIAGLTIAATLLTWQLQQLSRRRAG